MSDDRIYVTDAIRELITQAVSQFGPGLRQRVATHRQAYTNAAKRPVGSAQKAFVAKLMDAIDDEARHNMHTWLKENTSISDAADAAENFITLANYTGNDAWIIGDPLQISLIASYIVSNRVDFMRLLAGDTKTVTMWTTAPDDFDGAGTYRTGEALEALDSPYDGRMRTWHEIRVRPDSAAWQTSRNSSGLHATKTAEEMKDHLAWIQRAQREKGDIEKMRAIFDDALKRMPCVKWDARGLKYTVHSDDPQALIDAFAVASQARDEIRAFDVSGYPDPVRRIDEIYDKLKHMQHEAQQSVIVRQKGHEIKEANRKAIARATNYAQQWMDDNGLDSISFYVTPNGSYTDREPYGSYTQYYGSSVLTRLQAGAVAVGSLLFPAVGNLPILASLTRNSFIAVAISDYDANTSGADIGSAHSTNEYSNNLSDAQFAEAKRALLTVLRRGLPPTATRVTIYDGNTSYSIGGEKMRGLPDMYDVATGNTLHGPAKAKATRAENANRYIIFYLESRKFAHSPPPAYSTAVEKRIAANAQPPYASMARQYRLVLPDEQLSMQDVDRAILEL